MIPVKIKLTNFMSYTQETINFAGKQFVALTGSNGHGKSAIIDAITWCLWGYSRNGKSADDLVRFGQHQMQVEFWFKLDNLTYRAVRTRNKSGKGTTQLRLHILESGKTTSLTCPTIRGTQAEINKVLKIDYTTFINSVLILQGRANEFTSKSPAQRKEVLGEILSLDEYGAFEERCKEEIAEALDNTLALRANLRLERDIIQRRDGLVKERASLRQTASGLEKTNLLCRDGLDLARKRVHQCSLSFERLQMYDKILNEIALAEERLQDNQAGLGDKDEIERGYHSFLNEKNMQRAYQEKLELLTQRYSLHLALGEQIKQERQIRREKTDMALRELEDIESRISILEQSHEEYLCAVCGSRIDNRAAIEFDIEKLKTKRDGVIDIAAELGAMEEKPCASHDEWLESRVTEEEINRVKELVSKHFQESERLAHFFADMKNCEELERAIAKEEDLIQSLKESVPDIKDDIENSMQLENAKEELDQVERECKEAEANLNSAKVRLIVIQKELNGMPAADPIKTEKDLAVAEERLSLFKELRHAFGKNGIIAMLIDHAIPQIETMANSLLSHMAGGYSVRMETTRSLKSGDTAETLDILVESPQGTRKYDTFSGGERFRIDLAIRIALSKLLANRSGARLQSIIIDEGFGTQDDQGIRMVVNALNSIKDEFDFIMLITHIKELQDIVPDQLHIEKHAGESLAQWQA